MNDASKTDGGRAIVPTVSGGYWDDVAKSWRRAARQRLWREFSDRYQTALVTRWIGSPSEGKKSASGPSPSLSLLKTDLFDEVAGRGIVHRLLASGIRVTGIDFAPGIVAEAASRNEHLKAVVADVRSLPFAASTFDVVFSGSTLDHFETATDIQTALGELQRVLRPGGTLIMTLDNPANPLIWLRNGPLLGLFRRIGIVPYQVGTTLERRALEQTVQAAGFEVIETTSVMHCPRVAAVALAGTVGRMRRPWREWFLRRLQACERLERLPTRWLTGHYVAIHAIKPMA